MRQAEDTRLLLWSKKVALVEKALKEGKLEFSFDTEVETKAFFNLLTNFRATIYHNRKKYTHEAELMKLVSFGRPDSLSVSIYAKKGLAKGNISLLSICESLSV